MDDLKGHIAVVTGSSRGIGKGTAIALGEKGCTVYVTGRSTGDGDRTIDTTARLVTEAGGEGRAIQCDHGNDTEIEALFTPPAKVLAVKSSGPSKSASGRPRGGRRPSEKQTPARTH